MKQAVKLSLLALLLLNLITTQAAQLKIELKPYKQIKDGFYAVCIKRYDPSFKYISQYDTIFFSDNGKFNIDLSQGRYVLAMVHPSASIVYYNTYIENDESVVELKVQMDQASIPKQIDSVRLVGDFNNWQKPALTLKYDINKKHWFLPDDAIEEHINLYHLLINNDYRTHIVGKPTGELNTWCNVANINDEEDNTIIFTPSKYKQGTPKPVVSGKGADNEYHAMCEFFSEINNKLMETRLATMNSKDTISFNKIFYQHKTKLDSLKSKYEAKYPWVFPGWDLSLTQFSPIQMKIILASKDLDNESIQTLFKSQLYLDEVKKKAMIVKSIELNDLMLTSSVLAALSNLNSHILQSYGLDEELDIPFGFFEQLQDKILETSKNDDLCAQLLYRKSYTMYNRPDKARKLLLTIKEKYPTSSIVRSGNIDKKLKDFTMVKGIEAPDFKLVSIDGEEICLSKLKGKYVFIDFWGTWCSPCVQEIPNVKKLRAEIPADKLVVIGICQDQKEKVEKFIKENEINYPNIMANESILADYGVSKYPTTFLIDKEGVILAKDIRGENLTESIKQILE